ncbi:sensor histidine kinase [Marinobacter caseinilyticus]|uniref:sensor histidine kinase n=1 Tax=Marinobacter caseinilyticus TaxID=2692195 RepID=UPI001408743D|nr:ATP-binding protein [Marinobacter caseinilyticus]
MSLTRTLTLTLTLLVLTMALTAAVWSYLESNHELEEVFDAELAQNTRVVQGLVRNLQNDQSMAQLRETLNETLQLPHFSDNEDDEVLPGGAGHKYEKKIMFQVWSPTGEPLLASTIREAGSQTSEPGYGWIEFDGNRWRTFLIRDQRTGFTVRSAQRDDIRRELSQELALGNTLPLLVVLPLLILAVVAAIRWAFKPLARLEQHVRYMAPEAIQGLDESMAPEEVRGLVAAINGMLGRLDDALERERQFTANAAHELRTPLAALRLNVEHALPDNAEVATPLLESVDRMTHLVEQMLLLSRLDPDFAADIQRLDLATVTADALADIAPLVLAKNLELSFDDADGPCPVRCNAALIATLIRSLVANAIQFCPPRGNIQVMLRKGHQHCHLSINDDGPGIPRADRERALSRFVRLDQRKGRGAGLGLAIAQHIAELHGGSLQLDDRSDGHTGLCATVSLPLAA